MSQPDEQRREWFQQLVTTVGHDLLRFLRSRLGHGDLAQDLAQEVYLRLLRLDDVSLIRNPRSFVIHLAAHAVHEWRMLARNRLQHSDEGLEPLIAESSDPAELLECVDRLHHLDRVVGNLSPKRQSILLMHRRDGMTCQQIATRVNLSVGMVKKPLARALAECHEQLREIGMDPNNEGR
jgi:RNA polymerase sigma factor (sigma-70 family)